MTITEFLLARIAEDEAVANRNTGERGLGDDPTYPDYRTDYNADTDDADDYLKQFAPGRILAECAAKRAIIERHPIHVYQGIHGQAVPECAVGDGFPCDTLQALAAVYADHPDYLPVWGLVH